MSKAALTKAQIQQLQTVDGQTQFINLLMKLFDNDKALTMFTKNLYSFCTVSKFSCEQKQSLINVSLELLVKIPHHKVEKINFLKEMEGMIMGLARHTGIGFSIGFTQRQCSQILGYLKGDILPYYQFYECALDRSPLFGIECSVYDPIPKISEKKVVQGTVIEVDTIDILKEYVGEKAPKESKLEPKKK